MNENDKLNKRYDLSQAERIYLYMKGGGVITPISALRLFGCLRLASRICDIETGGVKVSRRYIILGNGKKVMEYYITRNDEK